MAISSCHGPARPQNETNSQTRSEQARSGDRQKKKGRHGLEHVPACLRPQIRQADLRQDGLARSTARLAIEDSPDRANPHELCTRQSERPRTGNRARELANVRGQVLACQTARSHRSSSTVTTPCSVNVSRPQATGRADLDTPEQVVKHHEESIFGHGIIRLSE